MVSNMCLCQRRTKPSKHTPEMWAHDLKIQITSTSVNRASSPKSIVCLGHNMRRSRTYCVQTIILIFDKQLDWCFDDCWCLHLSQNCSWKNGQDWSCWVEQVESVARELCWDIPPQKPISESDMMFVKKIPWSLFLRHKNCVISDIC